MHCNANKGLPRKKKDVKAPPYQKSANSMKGGVPEKSAGSGRLFGGGIVSQLEKGDTGPLYSRPRQKKREGKPGTTSAAESPEHGVILAQGETAAPLNIEEWTRYSYFRLNI